MFCQVLALRAIWLGHFKNYIFSLFRVSSEVLAEYIPIFLSHFSFTRLVAFMLVVVSSNK
jgi:hypothetical protein